MILESPVFKLEKVIHSRSEEMQDFEGPLDLILFLAAAAASGFLNLHFSNYFTFLIAAAAASVIIGVVFLTVNLACFRSECRELIAMAGKKKR